MSESALLAPPGSDSATSRRITRESVHAHYKEEWNRHYAEADRLAREDRTLSSWRTGAFLALVGTGILAAIHVDALQTWVFPPLAFLTIFLYLVIRHDRILKSLDTAKRLEKHYEAGLCRMEDRWAGTGDSGQRFSDPAHTYSTDLDLFGLGGLFELLCTARTRPGQACLASWLCTPADRETVLARQEAVADLRHRDALRRDLALTGEDVRSGLKPDMLIGWGERPVLLKSGSLRIITAVLSSFTVAAVVAWLAGSTPVPMLALFTLQQVFDGVAHRETRRVIRALDEPGKELALLSELLIRIERESFESAHLVRLRAGLAVQGPPISARLARLKMLIAYLEARRNQLFMPIGALLLWNTQLAYALEGWRAENGPHIARWIGVMAEIEALTALSTYSYENPDDPFPAILEDGARIEAEGLGHPLLPLSRMVRNEVRLDDEQRLLIVSGSNMSGKSTLLRSLGVNVILALAGAPVRARSLRLSPLRLGASIRTVDSLQGGVSRFYAEITRLRQITEIARENPPSLFLLDEILHGTNSHDRRIGAEAIVRALLSEGAIGLVTTHDLALARIADDASLHAANVHFQDHLEDGQMTFDYNLRPGVVQKSNAIELMRAVGLPV